jgi:asparagine synthase (glutamine-hydrolysing)
MCGIVGIYSNEGSVSVSDEVMRKMCASISHRGPDSSSQVIYKKIALGFNRLSIIDIDNGSQPFQNEDASIVSVCNGEIFNYKELRHDLIARGYTFKTNCDVEVLIPLYEEFGTDMFRKLNGQFAFVLYDRRSNTCILARDHFGICPLFYTAVNGNILFSSEVKALLLHPDVSKGVSLKGLDQFICLPGMISPQTMFQNIYSIKPGCYLHCSEKGIVEHEYWDLDYPTIDTDSPVADISHYIEGIEYYLLRSIQYRLNADVPVAYYLSGGLDSSLIGALVKKTGRNNFASFSVGFPQRHAIDERKYQRMISDHLNFAHHEVNFDIGSVRQILTKVIYHAEGPLKESYNTCSYMLSEELKRQGIKVTLCGEGADELFGGYYGYKFDQLRKPRINERSLVDILNDDIRNFLWEDGEFEYDLPIQDLQELREDLYNSRIDTAGICLSSSIGISINKERLRGRDVFNRRSYLDFKSRLAGHLIADHGDRMTYANSVEGRYPFLDIDLVDFVKNIPASSKLHNLTEKYILKEVAKKHIPMEIIQREKFGFVAPTGKDILESEREWVQDILSFDRIKRQGYFNPYRVQQLLNHYDKPGFTVKAPYELDMLMVALTFGIFLDVFQMPSY